MIKRRSIFYFALAFAGWLLCSTQGNAQLSEKDQRFLAKVSEELQLDATQQHRADSIYLYHQANLSELQNQVDSLEQYELDENMLNLKVNVLNQKKKDAKEQRELDLRALLTVDQKKIYDEKIKPQKPKVLHFGVHDRMKCEVCIK